MTGKDCVSLSGRRKGQSVPSGLAGLTAAWKRGHWTTCQGGQVGWHTGSSVSVLIRIEATQHSSFGEATLFTPGSFCLNLVLNFKRSFYYWIGFQKSLRGLLNFGKLVESKIWSPAFWFLVFKYGSYERYWLWRRRNPISGFRTTIGAQWIGSLIWMIRDYIRNR